MSSKRKTSLLRSYLVGYFLPARKLVLAERLRKPVFGRKYMGEKGVTPPTTKKATIGGFELLEMP